MIISTANIGEVLRLLVECRHVLLEGVRKDIFNAIAKYGSNSGVSKQATYEFLRNMWRHHGKPRHDYEIYDMLVDNGVDPSVVHSVFQELQLATQKSPPSQEVEDIIAMFNNLSDDDKSTAMSMLYGNMHQRGILGKKTIRNAKPSPEEKPSEVGDLEPTQAIGSADDGSEVPPTSDVNVSSDDSVGPDQIIGSPGRVGNDGSKQAASNDQQIIGSPGRVGNDGSKQAASNDQQIIGSPGRVGNVGSKQAASNDQQIIGSPGRVGNVGSKQAASNDQQIIGSSPTITTKSTPSGDKSYGVSTESGSEISISWDGGNWTVTMPLTGVDVWAGSGISTAFKVAGWISSQYSINTNLSSEKRREQEMDIVRQIKRSITRHEYSKWSGDEKWKITVGDILLDIQRNPMRKKLFDN